jgi:hypothetical protein
MKTASIALLSILLAPPVFADAGQHIVPAGSLIGCTLSEPRISSKTTAVGDPVLCQLGLSERYGRSVLPSNSYLAGRFEDYKDPGHFVGKGWMELKFDRMIIEPNTIIPVDARVVDVPGYKVDSQGRILGKGHVARDITLWCIPILWPIDLAMLPMRGPRPKLKEEARLTLKVMGDLVVPDTVQPQVDSYGLKHRSAVDTPPGPAPDYDQPPAPETAYAPPPDEQPQEQAYAYPPPPPPPAYAPPVMVGPPPVMAYGYGGAIVVSRGPAYGAGFYAARPRGYGYGYAPRAYGRGPAPRGYAAGPRAYGYGGPSRASQGYARGGYGGRAGAGFRSAGR